MRFRLLFFLAPYLIWAQNNSAPYKLNEVDTTPFFSNTSCKKRSKICFEKDFQNAIYSLLFYPKIAIKNNIEGTVYSQFTIDKNGSIVDIKLRGNHEILEKEALRTLNNIKGIVPATINNKTVSITYNFPIKFLLKTLEETTFRKPVQKIYSFDRIRTTPTVSKCNDIVNKPQCLKHQVLTYIFEKLNEKKLLVDYFDENSAVNEIDLEIYMEITKNGALKNIIVDCEEESLQIHITDILKNCELKFFPGKDINGFPIISYFYNKQVLRFNKVQTKDKQ